MTIQKNLYALKDLLDKNPHLFHSSPGDSAASRAPAMEQEAWKVTLGLHILNPNTHISLGRTEFHCPVTVIADENHRGAFICPSLERLSVWGHNDKVIVF